MSTAVTHNTKFQKLPLSASGRRIKIVATSDPGTLLYTGPDDASIIDEIWLHAYNTSSSAVTLSIEWGGTTSPDDILTYTLQAYESRLLDVSGCVLLGATTALTIRAYASVANTVTIGGYVNRAQ